ncbi:MAG: endonuclease [Nitrospinota bacterium]
MVGRGTCHPAGREGRADSGGVIDPSDCGFTSTKNDVRTRRLEWEHVVPASVLAGNRTCWKSGHALCVKPDGSSFKGRKCCEKAGVDDDARHMINDLHNLAPSIGEVNADRSNHPYDIVEKEPRAYGACDFEVGGTPTRAEPRPSIRGNVARIWLYMTETYNLPLSPEQRQMFQGWGESDPAGQWEIERDKRIEKIQGNKNPHVRN